MSYVSLRQRYKEIFMLETKRMAIFRTFPQKHFDLATELNYEENVTKAND